MEWNGVEWNGMEWSDCSPSHHTTFLAFFLFHSISLSHGLRTRLPLITFHDHVVRCLSVFFPFSACTSPPLFSPTWHDLHLFLRRQPRSDISGKNHHFRCALSFVHPNASGASTSSSPFSPARYLRLFFDTKRSRCKVKSDCRRNTTSTQSASTGASMWDTRAKTPSRPQRQTK